MKKIIFSMLAIAFMSTAAFADSGKKLSKKKAKANKCNTNCTNSGQCKKQGTTCPMPGCCH